MTAKLSEVVVPSVGESITEVIVSAWLKAEGTWVEKGEPIVTLETDKVNVDVPAPNSGVLTQILKKNDDTATIGEVLARIDSAATKPTQPVATPLAAPSTPTDAPKVMPAAQRVIAEQGLNANTITATGPGGRILKEDVSAPAKTAPAAMAVNEPAAKVVAVSQPAVSAGPRATEIVRMTPLRKRIAERLVQAQQTAALLTTFNEIDMSAVMAVRNRYKDSFEKRYGIKLGFMSFFVKATIDALRQVPQLNAQIQENNIIYHHYYDIGVAVDSGKGLVVPVMRNAELLSFAETEKVVADLGTRARAGKLELDELQGGTFTISNGGVFGSLMSTPIVNPPQSGILGMHSIQERPIGVDGQIVLRPMMYVALTYDHRIVDGRGAVTFLKRIKDCVENPERMLLEI